MPSGMQSAIQVVGCGARFEVWPQDVDNLVPVQPVAGRQCEKLHYLRSRTAAPGSLRNRDLANGYDKTAQEVNRQSAWADICGRRRTRQKYRGRGESWRNGNRCRPSCVAVDRLSGLLTWSPQAHRFAVGAI